MGTKRRTSTSRTTSAIQLNWSTSGRTSVSRFELELSKSRKLGTARTKSKSRTTVSVQCTSSKLRNFVRIHAIQPLADQTDSREILECERSELRWLASE